MLDANVASSAHTAEAHRSRRPPMRAALALLLMVCSACSAIPDGTNAVPASDLGGSGDRQRSSGSTLPYPGGCTPSDDIRIRSFGTCSDEFGAMGGSPRATTAASDDDFGTPDNLDAGSVAYADADASVDLDAGSDADASDADASDASADLDAGTDADASDASDTSADLDAGADAGIDAGADASDQDGGTGTVGRLSDPPIGRSYPGFAFDESRGVAVLFGGGNNGLLGDTWEWDGTVWTQRQPTVSPPARYGASMVYDTGRQKIMLFGGHGWGGKLLSDTWEYDGFTWTERTPWIGASPPPRWLHAMTYDTTRGVAVLFGGESSSLVNTPNFSDTWTWNGTTWSMMTPPVAPPVRYGLQMAFDSMRSKAVLHGGYETWEWDGASWTQASTQASAQGGSMVFDQKLAKCIMFGGIDNGVPRSDVATWEGSTWTAFVASAAPPARTGAAFTYDTVRKRGILFTGWGEGAKAGMLELLSDTWEWDGSTWTAK
jgi:hypothetical protein